MNQKKQLPTIRRRLTKGDPKPWHIGKCPNFDRGAMTQSLENYIDRVSYDGDIFNLGDSYRKASQWAPLDLAGLADLHLLINAILHVAPWGRVKKADMKPCVLNAIHRVHNRRIQVDCSYEEAAGRVAKQVLHGCLIFCCEKITYVHDWPTGIMHHVSTQVRVPMLAKEY